MDIEKIIASSNRRKILRVLFKTKQINIMDLVGKAKSTYNQVHSDLKILEKEGLLIDGRKGHSRMLSLNMGNPKTELVLKALTLLENLQREANNQQRS
jgi:DNA-binding transcriptional ArsR family regulator